ncbi:lipopolysaccharide kinase InaA family protein [uncultured Bacteroides sp.]|uniref:lipopolysaccharide kinase InaA family protein n=1 Tax=uncultured Bacteroides sp. TaxID=162156 RepID=UPI0025992875|nr:lipopolysaccharide kinase InaA family protein [uncultured Bacteroides sp.]
MQILIQPKYQSAFEFVSNLPEKFGTEGETIYASRNVVKRFKNDDKEWIVKRYKTPNLIQRLAYTFWRKSKAKRAFLYAQKLESIGIDTPEGIACVECKKYRLFHTGYFISGVCHYPPLYPLLVKEEAFDKRAASALAAFFVSMHQKGFFHGDPNLSNILYHIDEAGKYHFTVIDTNRSTFKASASPKECLENLKRITHRRDLLQYITEEYASLRGWDIAQSTKQVMDALGKFEKRKRNKRFYKKLF